MTFLSGCFIGGAVVFAILANGARLRAQGAWTRGGHEWEMDTARMLAAGAIGCMLIAWGVS